MWAALFSFALAAGLVAEAAGACSCRDHPSDAEFVARAKRIVLARTQATTLKPTDYPAGWYVEARYEVLESLKGPNEPKQGVLVEAVYGIGNCSLPLLTGIQYVVFLSGTEPESPGPCSGTFPFTPGIASSETELAALRERIAEASKSPPAQPHDADDP